MAKLLMPIFMLNHQASYRSLGPVTVSHVYQHGADQIIGSPFPADEYDEAQHKLDKALYRIRVTRRDPSTYLTRLRDAAFERYMISDSKADEEAWLDLEGRIRGYVRQTKPERIEQMKAERHAFNMAMDKEVNKLVSEPLAKAGWIYNMGKGNQPVGNEVTVEIRTGAFDPGKTMMAKDVDWGQRFLWRVAKATHHGDENVAMQPAISLEDWCVKHKDEIIKRTETPQGDGSIADAMLRGYKL